MSFRRRSALRGSSNLVLVLALGLAGCGYELGRGPRDPRGPFHVVAASGSSSHANAELAALAGARDELAKTGALGGASSSTLAIEILSVDEVAEAPEVIGDKPLARATRVVVSGRLRVHVAGAPEETGPIARGSSLVARGAEPKVDVLAIERARELAARELGARLVRACLGVPDPETP